MEAFLKDIFDYLVQNYALYLVIVMGVLMVLIVSLLNVLKKPIKKLTGKIQSDKLRKLANKSIIVLSFAIATLIWLVLHYAFPQYFEFRAVDIIISGALPIVIYSMGDGVVTSSKAKNLFDALKDIASDNKIDKDEAVNTVKELSNSLSDEGNLSDKNAEEELNKLLKK